MAINQLSIFVENKQGALAEITEIIASKKIDIRALSLADTQDFGILRLIVNNIEAAKDVLKNNNCVVSINKVLGVKIPDRPSGLANIVKILSDNGINLEYMYAFITESGHDACVVLRVENNEIAEKILTDNGIELLSEEDVQNL